MRVFEGRLSASGCQLKEALPYQANKKGEYKITHTGSTQEADRWHNVCCESAFQ